MPRRSAKAAEPEPATAAEPEIAAQRAASAGRRRPPGSPPPPNAPPPPKPRRRRPKLPLMLEIPSRKVEAGLPERAEPPPREPEPGDFDHPFPEPVDKPVYFCRFTALPHAVTLEIGADEDWIELERHVRAVEANAIPYNGCEVWGVLEDMAVRVWPSAQPEAQRLLDRKFRAAHDVTFPLFAPKTHPEYTVEQAQRDFEYRYKKAMGLLPGPPGVDGPVVQPGASEVPPTPTTDEPRIVAGPLDDANRAGIKAIFGVELPAPEP
jgi:hypothetical protein